MALVLAETAAGGTALLFLTPLWTEVRRGFFLLSGAVVLALALGAAGAARAGSSGTGRAGVAVGLALGLAGATALWLLIAALGLGTAGRAVGIATVPLGAAMLAGLAGLVGEPVALSLFQLAAGALFTGAVLVGLLLGHWYLTDRTLPRGPINRMASVLVAAVALEAGALVAGGFGGPEPGSAATRGLNPLLTMAGSATWIALGMVAITGLIAAFIRLALRGTRPQAVQGATGFFYLAVITAFSAELAAKVRFLP